MDINDRIARASRRQAELQHGLDRAKDAFAKDDPCECMRLMLCVLQTIVNEVV